MSRKFNVAVVGATGAVGEAMLSILEERKFPVDQPDRFQRSVTHGKGNMPSFKDALTPEQIAVLWAYVGSRGGKEN